MTKPAVRSDISFAEFAKLLQSTFRIRDQALPVIELQLTQATPHRAAPDSAQPGTFSLMFTGPQDRFLPQKTYLFEHEKLGTFHLFIVPVSKDEKGFHYEAIFNRVVPPA